MKPMKFRKLSREVAMEMIFSGNRNTSEEESILDEITDLKEEINKEDLDREYIEKLIKISDEKREEIETLIRNNLSKNWTLERISRVDRAILTLAIAEIMAEFEDVDVKVSINEALELTKKFSEEESVKFVNSVLDKVITDMGKKA